MGDVQIGNNESGRKRVGGWVGGVSVVVTGMAEGRTTEGTIGCGACSQLARVEVREGGDSKQKKKREKGGQRQKREKKRK